jgi:hypothetical protein
MTSQSAPGKFPAGDPACAVGLKDDAIRAEESKKWPLPLGIDPSNDHHF